MSQMAFDSITDDATLSTLQTELGAAEDKSAETTEFSNASVAAWFSAIAIRDDELAKAITALENKVGEI